MTTNLTLRERLKQTQFVRRKPPRDWHHEQAAILRERQPDWLDWENVAEELEGMARSDRRALRSQLERLLIHLLKWRYEPAKRGPSWEVTILDDRDRIDDDEL